MPAGPWAEPLANWDQGKSLFQGLCRAPVASLPASAAWEHPDPGAKCDALMASLQTGQALHADGTQPLLALSAATALAMPGYVAFEAVRGSMRMKPILEFPDSSQPPIKPLMSVTATDYITVLLEHIPHLREGSAPCEGPVQVARCLGLPRAGGPSLSCPCIHLLIHWPGTESSNRNIV